MSSVYGIRHAVHASRAKRARLTLEADRAVTRVNQQAAVTISAANRAERAAVALMRDHDEAMDIAAAAARRL